MRKSTFVCLLLVLSVLLTSHTLQAQSAASATITGRVTDPQGAVVANATVTARNVNTGVERAATTTGSGFYNIPNVPPGAYEVRVAASGFAKGVSNVELQVGDERDVNFQLIVGSAATTVEVSGEAPLIETTKTEVSTSVTAVDMSRLPVLSGGTGVSNDYAQLALSVPGVHADTSGNTGNGVGGNGDLVAPGAFNYRGNLYNVDGANIVDQVVSGRDAIGASVDEIQEFQVLTNNYNAEYGQAGGVIINAVTKSGTNAVHGDGHMFFRGRNLTSSDPFYNLGLFEHAAPGDGRCPAKNFVGTALVSDEGCTRAPFHKKEGGFTLGGPFIKNRLFWFGSFEDTRQSLPITLTPNTGPVTVQQPWNELLASAKLDWVISSRNTLSARYNVQRDRENNLVVQTGNSITPDSLANTLFNDEVINIGFVSTITPHLTNEARFTRHQFVSTTPDVTTVPGQAHNTYYTGADFCCPQGANQKRYQYIDNLSWTKGSHTLKTGFNISYYPYFSLFQQFHFGQYTSFDASDTIPGEFDLGIGPGAVRTKDNIYGFFLQDSWRIFHNFTLNYGLRYDAEAGAFRGGTAAHSGSRCFQGNGMVPACSSDYNNFQPRLGFAWEPWRGTLVHAGFGEITELAYNNIGLDSLNFDSATLNTAIITDPTVLAFYPNFPSAAALAPFVGNLCPTTKPGGCGRVRPISANLENPEIRHVNFGIQHQFGQSFMAEVQYVGAFAFHEFGERDLNARQILADPLHPGYFYWGARPLYQIPGVFDTCADGSSCLPASQFTNVRTQQNDRTAHYNGLLASVTKRLSNHIAFQAGYTWSHTLTSSEDFYGLSEPGDARNPGAEFGPAYNDIRHAFNFGVNFDTAKLTRGNWFTGTLVNNWIFGFVGQFQSGRPYPISTGVGEYSGGRFFGIGSETNQRPSVLPDGTIVATNISSSSGSNLAVGPNGVSKCGCPQTTFLAPPGAFIGGAADSFTGDVVDFQMPSGNLERNAALGSPFARLNLSVKKLFHPVARYELLEVELVGQFFNLFNHPNWQGFNSNDVTSFLSVGSAPGCLGCIDPATGFYVGNTGRVLHVQDLRHGKLDRSLFPANQEFFGLGDPAAAELPRTIQLSLRVRF
ncbi:MAG: hypothetical protein JWO91_1467 [Acidobacteriaceae bacterium]|nr:hypothetical protein [Acidobacteriaceae bacterium]